MTPAQFSSTYNVDAKRLRAYPRKRWPHAHNDRWTLDDAMVHDARAHFGVSTTAPVAPAAPLGGSPKLGGNGLVVRKRSAGLHIAVLDLATQAGIPLVLGSRLPWLTGQGHTAELVRRSAPRRVIAALQAIHSDLGGDERMLASKSAANSPTPDLVHEVLGCIIEVDEVQHFTSSRLQTFARYPSEVPLGYDVDSHIALVGQWRSKGDRAFAHKVARDFPNPGGRQAQRAYNDALRDLLAPTFTGYPVIRLAVPDRSVGGVVQQLKCALAAVQSSE